MIADFDGKTVLVTGDLAGNGLATALEFGRRGATCILATSGEGVDEDVQTVRQVFASGGVSAPHFLSGAQLDLQSVTECGNSIDVLICAAPPSVAVESFAGYNKADFLLSVEAGAWQVAEQTQRVHEVCGRYPRYVLALSPASAFEYSHGADFSAASAAALETLCRYMNYHLHEEDIRINVLRYRESAGANTVEPQTAGEPHVAARTPDRLRVTQDDVARAAVALCSGLMDCMRGHVLTVDRGGLFCDNLMRLYNEREQPGL